MPHFYRIPHVVVALAASLLVSPAAVADYLEVNFRDGTTTSFDLSDRPNVSLVDTRMIIKAGTAEAEYESALVATFYIKDGSGIAETVMPGETRLTYRDRDRASVSGLDAGMTVFLYSADGRLIESTSADMAGEVSFDLSSLPKGAYIISINNGQSFKIIR